ncbi:hypothetical protein E2C01_076036 [Portunus trituberculatus]|uniref:Uncharacterized protein n=1 Tax=Portunus trituberculatus TaxID=210409 RepID=A0A5B7IAC5_PORTR|nr:hypothetical protein [Portunus trituberculatus]
MIAVVGEVVLVVVVMEYEGGGVSMSLWGGRRVAMVGVMVAVMAVVIVSVRDGTLVFWEAGGV